MHTQESVNQLFNGNSKAFGEDIEQQYQSGSYRRGEVFLDLVKAFLPSSHGRVLDYGCGTGRMSIMLGKAGYAVTGVDPAVNHIEMACALNDSSQVTFRVLTSEPIAPPQTFDAVVSSSVFEFVPDPQQYTEDIYTLLKPGGKLIISFPNPVSLWRVYSKWRFGNRYQHFKFQKNVWSQADIIRHFEKNKFSKTGTAKYYESAFDKKGLGFLNASSLFGTLFVMAFEKKQ